MSHEILMLLRFGAIAGVFFVLFKFGPKTGAQGRVAKVIMAIAAVAAIACVPSLASTSAGALPLGTVVLCSVYALFALGLNIVVGFAGLLDLGYVAFFLFGAYTAAFLMSDFGYQVSARQGSSKHQFSFDIHFFTAALDTIKGVHISFWLVIIAAALVAAFAGLLIGAPTLRLKSDYLALVTLGFGEILPEVFRNSDNVYGFNLTNGTKGIGPVDQISMGYLHNLPKLPIVGKIPQTITSADNHTKFYVIVAICAVFVYASLKLRDGRLGRAWMAIREDELAASLMGVPLMRTKLWSYAVGAVAGGVGGAFYATIVGTVNVDSFTFAFSIIVLCAVILGGMGNVWGAIAGGVVITWFDYTGLTFLGGKVNQGLGTHINLKDYEFGLFGLVLVVMMLFRPQGLIPATRSKQVKRADMKTANDGDEDLIGFGSDPRVVEEDRLGYGMEVGVDHE
ncbi:MAG: branched-chain amino acid transport system permease protein [Acidimicrobiales bacterium]|nr:branched-chain amino acid transport system permease protein [Acidimicrobiales bacterium]